MKRLALLVLLAGTVANAQTSAKFRKMDAYITDGVYNAAMHAFPAKIPSVVAERTLTGGVGATLTFSAAMGGCPVGVAGADANHSLYISGGVGTAEAVLITGGTCTSGAASGTITFTPANTHSGTWNITSATGGIQEALSVAGAAGATINLPLGTTTMRSDLTVVTPSQLEGQGRGAVTFSFSGSTGLKMNPTSAVLGVAMRNVTINTTSTTTHAWTISKLTNAAFENIQINGPGSGAGGTNNGINIAVFARSSMRNIEVRKFNGDCIAFNGESSGGIYGANITMDECGAYDFNFTRTTAADSGDYYWYKLTGLNSTSVATMSGGLRWSSSAGGQSAIATWCNACIADNIKGGDSIIVDNIQNMFFTAPQGNNSHVAGGNKSAILLKSSGNIGSVGGRFDSLGYCMTLAGNATNYNITGPFLTNCGTGIHNDAAGTLTNVSITSPTQASVTTFFDTLAFTYSSATAATAQLRSQRTYGKGWWLLSQASNIVFSTTTGAVDETVFSVGEAAGSAFTMANRAVTVAASTTARPSMNVPSGSAPTTPAGGDLWFATVGPGTPTRARPFFYDGTSTMDGSLPIYSAAGAVQGTAHIVSGTVVLVAGAATVTLTNSAVFTSSGSFICTATDQTAANAVKIVPASATTITVAGTGTDTIAYDCKGN